MNENLVCFCILVMWLILNLPFSIKYKVVSGIRWWLPGFKCRDSCEQLSFDIDTLILQIGRLDPRYISPTDSLEFEEIQRYYRVLRKIHAQVNKKKLFRIRDRLEHCILRMRVRIRVCFDNGVHLRIHKIAMESLSGIVGVESSKEFKEAKLALAKATYYCNEGFCTDASKAIEELAEAINKITQKHVH